MDGCKMFNEFIDLMYEVWLVSVPFAREKWKIDYEMFTQFSDSNCYGAGNSYVTGSVAQVLDFLKTTCGDVDMMHENNELLIAPSEDAYLSVINKVHSDQDYLADKVFFLLEESPETPAGYYKLRLAPNQPDNTNIRALIGIMAQGVLQGKCLVNHTYINIHRYLIPEFSTAPTGRHSPALNLTGRNYDIVPCIRCISPGWPEDIKQQYMSIIRATCESRL